MADVGNDEVNDEEIYEHETYGSLILKLNSKGGYCGVTKTSSKKNPYQAVVINKRRGKQQGIGSYSSANIAAIRLELLSPSSRTRPKTWSHLASTKSEVNAAPLLSPPVTTCSACTQVNRLWPQSHPLSTVTDS